MFAIYNNGSVNFRSTADNLYEIKNTEKPQKSSLKPDDDSLFQDYLNQEKDGTKANQKQLNVYKKIAHIDTSDIVYHVKDIMTKGCISISILSSIHDAYNKLSKNQVTQIAVLSGSGKLMGMINKKMILNLLMEDIDSSRDILNRKLEGIYFPEIITTDPISDIRRVSKVLIDFDLDAIPVVDKNEVLVGIVSKKDIIKAVSNIPKLQLWA